MLLSYYFAITVLSSYIAQVRAPNETELSKQTEITDHLKQNPTTQTNLDKTIQHQKSSSGKRNGNNTVTKERRHKCDVCDKLFNRPCKLKIHMRIHTGEKPFKCNQCNATFKRIYEMQRHEAKHSEERLFLCDECGKGFKRSDSLQRHKLMHSEKRPFECEKCGKGFKRKQDFQRHKRLSKDKQSFKYNKLDGEFKSSTKTVNSSLTIWIEENISATTTLINKILSISKL